MQVLLRRPQAYFTCHAKTEYLQPSGCCSLYSQFCWACLPGISMPQVQQDEHRLPSYKKCSAKLAAFPAAIS